MLERPEVRKSDITQKKTTNPIAPEDINITVLDLLQRDS